MDLIDLLNDHADLPRTAGHGLYLAELRETLSRYATLVESLAKTDLPSALVRDNAPAIRKIIKHLIAVHEATLLGREKDAHNAIHQVFSVARPYLDTLTSVPLNRDRLGWVFRLRAGSYSDQIDRGGLFHIPFEKRHLAAPMRYSMLGIPMLYLGATTYVCWEELGRPSFDDLWVCGLRLKKGAQVRLIDLGHRPAEMAAMLHANAGSSGHKDFVVAYATIWPLIAACSFRKRHPRASFAEEYVIPQRLAAYLVETKAFDGIRFFSTHIGTYQLPLVGMNFVFPAHPSTSTGHCPHLCRLFEMTSPTPWTMVTIPGSPINTEYPLAVPDHLMDYERTHFAQVEAHIRAQTMAPV